MLTLSPVITVSYGVKSAFLVLSILEFSLGILVNSFIVLVNLWDVVRRQPLSHCNLVLLCLSLTRLFLHGLLFLEAIQLIYFQKMKDPLTLSYQTIILLWMIVEQASLWLATCLSLLYCSKIIRFSHICLVHLARWVSQRMGQLVLGAVFSSAVCTVFCLGCYFNQTGFLDNSVFFLNGSAEQALQVPKLNLFFHSFLYCSLNTVPTFLTLLGSSGLLIVSLGRHLKTMRASSRGAGDPSLEAHIRALKSLVPFLCLYIVSFGAALLSLPLLLLWHKKVGVMVCVGVMAACPSGHAIILITGNPKLRRAVRSLLVWAQSIRKVRVESRKSVLC
ncbi:taste receptor type 2 member 38 [Erinaceus europaeus]|uniref:Taste receptor type 2 n=1 Tax=Erinaceus europaeus TaxID=9365 RepID=A0ABM3XV69_ERIEU|nr:taste receptor type 2 member 38 [Erinaceus europaeus]